MKKEETQNTLTEEKKKSKKGLIIFVISILLIAVAAVVTIFVIKNYFGFGELESGIKIKTKWGKKYYKELKNIDMKKIQERYLNMKVEDIEEIEVAFLHGYNTKYPLMVINFENSGKKYTFVYAINHNTSKEEINTSAYNEPMDLQVIYDAEVGGFDRSLTWTIDEGESKGVREYFTFRYLAHSYLPSSLIVYQKNDKSDVYEKYDVTDKVIDKANFTYNLKKDSNKDLAKKINDAIDKVKFLEDYFTDEEIAAIKKAAENKKIEIVEGKNKTTDS